MPEIITLSQLESVSKKLHAEHKSIVITGGCFDILHLGHFTLLQNAKTKGDILMVMLESDESIKIKKGIDRPVHTQKQRAEMLLALRAVDYVIMLPYTMADNDYDNVVKQAQPAIIATTSGDPYAFHKERQATLTGAKVVYANHPVENISTSRILDLLAKET